MKLGKGCLISNRYEIINKIGSGGMAIVYKAIDSKLDRIVTLKIMREEHIEDNNFLDRFDVEARAAAKLNHPNIVNIYDVGRYKDIYYIVMEYIEGVTLKDLIISRGMFSEEEILGVAIQITSALDHAHENKIVHRDVKPQNILINTKGEVKVADFGIATAITNKSYNLSGNTVGSVHYFSPEQARGSNIDDKSDIYSIAITMYEMACGHVPFDGDTVVAIVLKHVNTPLPDIKSINPKLSDDIIEIIYKAGEKIKTDRYSSANEMNNDLKKSLTKINGLLYTNPYDFSKTSTINLTEKDVEKIKREAISAFYDRDDYYNERDFTKEKKVARLGIIGTVLTTIILSVVIFNYFKKQIVVILDVPQIVGMPYESALDIMYKKGIEVKIVKEDFSDIYDKNFVIEQDYILGDTIKKGGEVKISLSLGSDKKPVPFVEGKSKVDALKEFNDLTFTVEEVYVYNNLVDIDYIIEQTPKGGEKVGLTSEVILFISKGKENRTYKVPNLVTITKDQAIASIGNSNLLLGTIIYKYSDTVGKNVVMAQEIEAGVEVKEKTKINITVSKGKEIKVPEKVEPIKPVEPTKPKEEKEEINIIEEEINIIEEEINIIEDTDQKSNLKIETLFLQEGEITAQVKILEVSSNLPRKIYEKRVAITELPLNIEVRGKGVIEYQLYVDTGNGYVHSASSYINYNEVNRW